LLGNAYREVRERHPEIFYIVVPRHFERAAAVKAQLEADGLFPALRSELGTPVSDATDCVIVDTTGELRAWYYLADVVVIGKSFISTGGQNPVEALLAGKPVLFGPHMENFRALVESLNTAGGTRQVADIAELREVVLGLLDEPESGAEMVAKAREVLAQHDGATARTSEILLGD
jgi:3-deoxy-D-manno-octulosonic-acid transferase